MVSGRIYNPAGWLGNNPQGSVEAAGGSGGAGSDLIDEDFTTDPLWPSTGNVSVSGGQAIATPLSGADFYKPTYTAETEVWMQYDFIPTSLAIVTNGQSMFGGGIQDEGGNSWVNLGVTKNGAATLVFAAFIRDDSGETKTELSPTFTAGNTYDIVMHAKAATAPAANDGIARIWIDGVLAHESTSEDSDTKDSRAALIGSSLNSGTVTAEIRTDNVKVGTTGSAPS